jgi:lipopolysaccharide export system protein LptC
MSAPDAASTNAPPHASPVRPRSSLVVVLRIALPAIAIGLTLLVLGWTIASALRGAREVAAPPLAMTSSRLVGQDEKKRPFVITAARAVREPNMTQRIDLERPTLARDEGGPDALHVSADRGVYDEQAGRLSLAGDVRISGANGHFVTPAAVYDTKTGNVVGSGAVRGAGDAGELQAGAFSARDKGQSVTYKGGVHARMNSR